ncbi:MAG: metalloregulator ArsR/SmtB family transcription factor [Ancalomicrobiaceae bacterium]|nr:metalloregulator ArsR/SmtB family transcription factor [Ancalomicrobiaceae bacterium]
MLNHHTIDECFRALAEPARRAIVERLSDGPASVSQLAAPFDMTLAAVVQHVQVLEKCGLIRSEKIGRNRVCRVDPAGLDVVSNWVGLRRSMVERQLDRLGALLASEPTGDEDPPETERTDP